jgi:hypothetical protein
VGIATLPALERALVEAGLDPATPAALIESGATENEHVYGAFWPKWCRRLRAGYVVDRTCCWSVKR